MSVGLILLIIVAILILFGVCQRVLDGLRLTDRQALLFVALIFVGGIIGDIPITPSVSVNIGGFLIPIGLCVYLFIKAGTAWEKWRSVIAAVITAVAVWLLGHYLPNEPETMPFDVNYAYGLLGGVVAYVFGRSRRGAFIAGVLGVALADIWQGIANAYSGIDQRLVLGGAGAFDVIVISGLSALLLSELIGEILERATTRKRSGAIERGEKRR